MVKAVSPAAGEYAARRHFEVRVFRARWFALPLALALVTALRSDPLWLSLLALGGYLLHNVARSRLILRGDRAQLRRFGGLLFLMDGGVILLALWPILRSGVTAVQVVVFALLVEAAGRLSLEPLRVSAPGMAAATAFVLLYEGLLHRQVEEEPQGFAVRAALLAAVGVAGVVVARRRWREQRLAWAVLPAPSPAAIAAAAPAASVAPAAVPEPAPPVAPNPLTPTQRRVLRLVEAGMTNEQIAREQGRGGETVKTHLRSVYERLGVNDREAAARLARLNITPELPRKYPGTSLLHPLNYPELPRITPQIHPLRGIVTGLPVPHRWRGDDNVQRCAHAPDDGTRRNCFLMQTVRVRRKEARATHEGGQHPGSGKRQLVSICLCNEGGIMRRTLSILLTLMLTISTFAPIVSAQAPATRPGAPAASATATGTAITGSTATGAATAPAGVPNVAPPPRGAAPTVPGTLTPEGSRGTTTPPVAGGSVTPATPTARPTLAAPVPATLAAPTARTTAPARGLNALTVATTNPAIGAQRFQTFIDQSITDRQQIGVNVANGNLLVRGQELSLRGTGLSVNIERTYNNLSTEVDMLGRGTNLNIGPDVHVQENADGSVFYFGPSGFEVSFAKNGTTYTTPTGLDATLTKGMGGTFTLAFHASGEKYAFNAAGALATDTDRNGNAITYNYNPDGTLGSITDTQGRTVFTNLGSHGDGTKRIDAVEVPGMTRSGYEYDANKNLTGAFNNGEVTRFYYTGTNLTKITTPKGNDITLTYDAQNRVTGITRVTDSGAGTGPTTIFTYTSGTTTVVKDANNHTTTYTYDGMGRVTGVKDANNNTQSTTYSPNSNVLTYTDSATKTWSFTYGANNGESMTQVQSPTGAKATLAYTDSVNTYSPTSFTDAQGNAVSYTYDPNGNRMSSQNGLMTNNQTHSTYNTNGTVATTTDALGRVTTYGYDAGNKNLTSITPPTPLGATTIEYDPYSRPTKVRDGKGQETYPGYDGRSRITNLGGIGVGYGYDPNGNVTVVHENQGDTSFTYDPLNRQLTKNPAGDSTITYTYDGVGNLLSLADTGGTTSYAYNAVNLLVTLTEPGNQQTTFTYNTNNARTGTTYPNGVTMTEAYDNAGRLTSIAGAKGATPLTGFSYSYAQGANDRALRQSMTDTVAGVTTTYSYDAVNRLLRAQNPTDDYQYTYDGADNRLTATRNGTSTFPNPMYNAANQLTSLGGTSYSYDANGNLTGSGAGLSLSYASNGTDQTTSITPVGGSANAYTYAGASQVQRITVGSTRSVYTVLGLSSETTSNATTQYTRDNGGRLVGMRLPNGTRYYYLFDGLGSVVAVTDSSGAVVNTYKYDPYGVVTPGTGNSVANPWQYTGGYYDAATGLVKLGQRYYDPKQGRWTQLDPLGGGYVYTSNNPINFTDTSGLQDFYNIGYGQAPPGFAGSLSPSPGFSFANSGNTGGNRGGPPEIDLGGNVVMPDGTILRRVLPNACLINSDGTGTEFARFIRFRNGIQLPGELRTSLNTPCNPGG